MLEQSASFPGKPPKENAFFLLTKSLAFLAASLALAASITFEIILFAVEGFSSKNSDKAEVTIESTKPFTSLFPNLVFVCPSNWGSGIFMLIIAVKPSLTSSPERFPFFNAPFFFT
ncbi:hypothetical protein ES703_68556 [subsurface metagenome]